uniref:Uncharacterized protein n=1 Tax=Ditylenchus dipsaci TaxID=166011 RepID=A0A915EV58_9BILA
MVREDADDLFNSLRHIKCSAHRLQNSVKNVFERKDPRVEYSRRRCLISFPVPPLSPGHDEIGGEDEACAHPPVGYSLELYCNVHYFQPTFEIRREFNEVCFELDWRYANGTPMRITEADAEAMNVFISMLGPIWRFTIRLQEEASPTLSLLLPGLNSMLAEFETAPLFLASSALDYRTLPYVLDDLQAIESAIKKMYADRFGEEVNQQSDANEDVSRDSADDDLFGSCGASVSWMNDPSPSSLAAEVLLHLDKARLWKLGKKGSTWQYWIYHASTLPRLTKLAFDLLPCFQAGIIVEIKDKLKWGYKNLSMYLFDYVHPEHLQFTGLPIKYAPHGYEFQYLTDGEPYFPFDNENGTNAVEDNFTQKLIYELGYGSDIFV